MPVAGWKGYQSCIFYQTLIMLDRVHCGQPWGSRKKSSQGVEAPVWQGANTPEYLDIPSRDGYPKKIRAYTKKECLKRRIPFSQRS